MKKLFIILSVFVIVSCSKDDPKPVSKIVGTWTAASSETAMTVNGKSYEQYLVDNGFSAEDAASAAELMAQLLSLTGFFAEIDFNADGTWSGTSQFVTTAIVGKWTLTSDETQLALTNNAAPGETQTGKITKLTDTDLWIEVKPEADVDGVPANFEYTTTIKCTRKK